MFGGHGSSGPDPEALKQAVDEQEAAKPQFPDSFVVVLAYDAVEGDTSAEFAEMVESFKALFSLRAGHRVYALFDESAQNVLALVEKPASGQG